MSAEAASIFPWAVAAFRDNQWGHRAGRGIPDHCIQSPPLVEWLRLDISSHPPLSSLAPGHIISKKKKKKYKKVKAVRVKNPGLFQVWLIHQLEQIFEPLWVLEVQLANSILVLIVQDFMVKSSSLYSALLTQSSLPL